MVFRTITYAMGFKRNFGWQGSVGKREPFSWRGFIRKLIGGD
jgi:hypothetical protein